VHVGSCFARRFFDLLGSARGERLGPCLWPLLQGDLIAARERLFRAGRGEAFFAGTIAPDPYISERADPVSIEWIYIVDAIQRRLHVFASRPLDPKRYEHFEVGAFDTSAEPDWRACQRARNAAAAPVLLEDIRVRFSDQAYEAARRQMLGDDP
jgi:hypothetical protein